MISIDSQLRPDDLASAVNQVARLAREKVLLVAREYDASQGSPVFTIAGKYTIRGWTEWTQGFQYGLAILAGDLLDDTGLIERGRHDTVEHMAPHVSHIGVHDHGFNNVSTYGNLLRLMNEGRLPEDAWERNFYELALKVSGAVQAARWTTIPGGGFMHSFNGPHSLFVDTIRSCRILVLSHALGHALMAENDRRIDLLGRAIEHARATAQYNIFYGEGRDSYDLRGRTAHEAVFNTNDGAFRCPNAQQGYTGFSTWTRGLAWAVCGFPEELEFLATLDDDELEPHGGRTAVESVFLRAARATADFFIEQTPADGVPYWDTGAPNLHRLGDYLDRPAEPFNDWEPVDSSAAAIAAQGLLRLGRFLQHRGDAEAGERYLQAGLTVARTLFDEPYLSTDSAHQGLLLHSIYHQPNGWDHIPEGRKIACGESSMWGDYHALELALTIHRLAGDRPEYAFHKCLR